MQLLDLEQQSSGAETVHLLKTLKEITSKIQLQTDFSIYHPDFKPLVSTPGMVERLRQLPISMQEKFVSLQLRGFLYGVYYNGSLRTTLALDSETNSISQQQNLENNSFLGVDLDFSNRLHHVNNGKGYYDAGWQILKEEDDGTLAVKKFNLILHIQRKIHLHPDFIDAQVGEEIAILMPRNRLQNGFYMAVGNAGKPSRAEIQGGLTRVYFHLQPEGAIALMSSLTSLLNQAAIPFCFKVLYNPGDYQRYDAGVLYFDKLDYETINEILRSVYSQQKNYFRPEIPLFTKLIAPGLGLAEEPNQRFSQQESFGLNRCQIVAQGFLNGWNKEDKSSAKLIQAIFDSFEQFDIDWQRPYLNPNSEDIYRSFMTN